MENSDKPATPQAKVDLIIERAKKNAEVAGSNSLIMELKLSEETLCNLRSVAAQSGLDELAVIRLCINKQLNEIIKERGLTLKIDLNR